jgi:hypothetical protein
LERSKADTKRFLKARTRKNRVNRLAKARWRTSRTSRMGAKVRIGIY